MSSPMQKTALPCLSLILLIWSQGPGAQGQEFQFGPCRVEGVVFQELWEASRAVKDIVQAQDNIMSVQLLRREVLQNVSGAESCYLLRALLNFYLNTVFRNYHKKAAELRILKSFSTLANNFIVILSKLQPSENEMFPIRESARRRFLLFQAAFKQEQIHQPKNKWRAITHKGKGPPRPQCWLYSELRRWTRPTHTGILGFLLAGATDAFPWLLTHCYPLFSTRKWATHRDGGQVMGGWT
ncbi:interleukin-24 isoform X2 [Myotis daubentonii]|uniref:interleukin-24 isoform X2 n=1 Tax=Myotis daubentonii TaxID=98922 RepID=UPI002873C25D|nr:interleukin-24 isoform X2 [Myotis daubentonii]